MHRKWFLYCTIVFSSIHNALSICETSDGEDCNITVTCKFTAGRIDHTKADCSGRTVVHFVVAHGGVFSSSALPGVLTAAFFATTNFDSMVRTFTGVASRWNKIESTTFKYYPKLEAIDLSHNEVKVIKDEAFSPLTELVSLNISRNAIEMLGRRVFLISASQTVSLKVLDLSKNLLTDLTSPVFDYLEDLEKLYLHRNNISSISEDCLLKNKKLKTLTLNHNRILSLNMTLMYLVELKELDVSFNLLTKINGNELNRLVSLEKVNMSSNAIEFVDVNCFNHQYNLREVDFSHNRINFIIESTVFINNTKLTYLNLYDNNIMYIKDNSFLQNRLSYLNLSKNNISGVLPQLGGLGNITSLNLSNQNISVIHNSSFYDAFNLINLNLSNNYIDTVEHSSFTRTISLTTLDLSHNNISDIGFLKRCLPKLTELYLQNNNITAFPGGLFDDKSLLIKLDISMNMIFNIAPNSLPLSNIQIFNITGNTITGSLKQNMVSPAKFLRYLELCHFNISRIEKTALVDMPLVARINISHNQIEYIDPVNFKGMDNMYSLDFSYNNIRDFYFINNSAMNNLKSLYLNNNRITNINRTMANMTSLVYVDLSYNYIIDLNNVPFSTTKSLKVLILSNNQIKNFNTPQTNFLQNLTMLYLSSNQLNSINLTYFRDLVNVDVSNNSISRINNTFFDNLDSLQSLDISNNNISDITPGTFQNVKILKVLNLSHNNMTRLRFGTFKGLHRAKRLDLSYNKISEIEISVFHECTDLERLIIDYNLIKQLDVEKLILLLPELTTISLGGNPINCKEVVRYYKNTYLKNFMLRQVEITAVDKIYHEDNVHGIRCGDTNETIATEIPLQSDQIHDHKTSVGLVVWCTLLSIIVIAAAVFYVIKYRRKQKQMLNRVSRMQLRNSLEVSSVEAIPNLLD